ncbi:thermonuclease family protein [Listeria grayi]|uniref:thermonuclease family protein n=1 Tax=Listeria grayi TaxID=1641 RepID=UPI001623C4E0|nr:thermonuclease family protein [Listeria grayi]MBC1922975.1 thermonuclease [Listeria grayi]
MKKYILGLTISTLIAVTGITAIPKSFDFGMAGSNGFSLPFSSSKKPVDREHVQFDHVIDGDTVAVKLATGEKRTIRLLLIDTPESVKPGTPVQPFSKAASNYMKQFVNGKKLEIEYDRRERKDRYDRVLAYPFADGKNVNEVMIKKGYARIAYVKPPNTKYLKDFQQAEASAKKVKKRIWSIPGYVTHRGFEN